MTSNKYIANDKVTYEDSNVYINKFNIKEAKALATLEQIIVTNKLAEISNYPTGDFNLQHICNLHQYFFEDLYPWAGELRSVDLSKDSTRFCNVRFIIPEFKKVYAQIQGDDFLQNVPLTKIHTYLANYYSDLNMIHPFRDGNGRTIRAYLALMVYVSHNIVLNYGNLQAKAWIHASIASVHFHNEELAKIFAHIVKNSKESAEKI